MHCHGREKIEQKKHSLFLKLLLRRSIYQFCLPEQLTWPSHSDVGVGWGKRICRSSFKGWSSQELQTIGSSTTLIVVFSVLAKHGWHVTGAQKHLWQVNAFKERNLEGFMEELELELRLAGWADYEFKSVFQFIYSFVPHWLLCTLKVRQICDLIKHSLRKLWKWRR